MVSPERVRRALLGRDVGVAFAVLVALYVVRSIRVQPLQIPAYLLIVAYDVVEMALPVLTPFHAVGFPIFLYALAVVAAGATRRFRPGDGDGAGWPPSVGGVSLVVGVISLSFGAMVGGPVVSSTDNPTPLAITGTTGIVLLVVGWWLLGRPIPGERSSS